MFTCDVEHGAHRPGSGPWTGTRKSGSADTNTADTTCFWTPVLVPALASGADLPLWASLRIRRAPASEDLTRASTQQEYFTSAANRQRTSLGKSRPQPISSKLNLRNRLEWLLC